MKIAYFCEPQVGGTFSFFKRVRPHLLERGIDFRCIPPLTAECFPGTPYADLDGVDYVSFPDHPARATAIMIRHLEEQGYDAVMILPGTDITFTNIVRYLPRSIRALARVPMITRGAYAPTLALQDHLDRVVGVSDRVASDLTGSYGLSEAKVRVVYNGVEPLADASQRTYQVGDPFHLLFSGRISDLDKGVLLLPNMMRRLVQGGLDAHLTMIGHGPDEAVLRAAFKRAGVDERVKMEGNVSLDQVTSYLREAHCFVLPSRFEGCPNALMEAMGAGCPCVAARIRGSVDVIIEEGKSGLLANVADAASFAERILELARDPSYLTRLGEGARLRIQERFTIQHTADGYAEILHALNDRPDQRVNVLSMEKYSIPIAMQPTWRTRIPAPIKNSIRKWLERFGISS